MELGLWSVDIKLQIKFFTVNPNDTEMHRLVLRGQTHFRERPSSERFVVGSQTDSLTKTKITEGEWNWLMETWLKSNKKRMPSLNQIEAGLIAEAMVQVEMAMGSIKDQKKELATKANIKKTWEDLLGKANIHGKDRDKPLIKGIHKEPFGLIDAKNSVTKLMLFIYQMENWCYRELNLACRYKDHSKVSTLGPWAYALNDIVSSAQ